MSERIRGNIENLNRIAMKNKEFIDEKISDELFSEENFSEIEVKSDSISESLKNITRQTRVAHQRKTIVLFGKFSTGKSTLLNGLLGFGDQSLLPKLPAKDAPTTAKPVRFSFTPDEDINSYKVMNSGEEIDISVEKAYELMETDIEEHANIAEIVLELNHAVLLEADLLDIPGRGTAYFEEHEHIVRSRLRDAAVILWLNGGPDEQHPGRPDRKLLQNLPEADNRKIIPLWNAKQKKEKRWDEIGNEELEQFKEDADTETGNLEDGVKGVATNKSLTIWALEAELNSNEESEKETGITELEKIINQEIVTANSPVQIACSNLLDSADSVYMINREIQGIILEEINNIKNEKSSIKKGIAYLHDAVFQSEEAIRRSAENIAEEAVDEKIEPELRDFIDIETSAGGVIHTAWKSAKDNMQLNLKKFANDFEKDLEENLRKRLDKALNFGDPENGWLAKLVRQKIEDLQNKLNQKWLILQNRLVDELDIEVGMSDQGQSSAEGSVMPPGVDSLAEGTLKNMRANLGAIGGAMITTIVSLIIFVGITSTSVNPVAILFALAAGGLMLRGLKNRMKGQVRAAAWEMGVHIKDLIRKPAKDYLLQLESYWEEQLNLNDALEKTRNLKEMDSSLRSFNSQLKNVDLEV